MTGARRPLSARLLEAVERRMFVSPALRKVLAALPDRPDPGSPQVAAVVALVVANAWMCLDAAALDLLRELDVIGGLGFAPREVRLAVRRGDDASTQALRLAVESASAKLGFPPGRRTRVSQVVEGCARAVAAHTSGTFTIHPLLAPRGLRLEAELEGSVADEQLLGSAPTWSPRRIERAADEFSLREERAGRIQLHAVFLAASTKGAP